MTSTTRPVDLSCLTGAEVKLLDGDASPLYTGDIPVALYLRYSSAAQSEQSIEGQLRDCCTYCQINGYRIAAVYVDRASTASKDLAKRVNLLKLVDDSKNQRWEYVIVWKLDRFAHNRNDSAVLKMKLRKNGVRVLSATEHLTDSPESIILESVLEGMAEFFSAELSQKVTRGMRESALKCQSTGGQIPLGYKVEARRLVPDPDTVPLVKEAFERYASGESIADICRTFNRRGYRTTRGCEFNRSSFKSMFRNERYIGVYTYKDIRIDGGVPAIIDRDLFDRVQSKLQKSSLAPGRNKAKVNYLLSGKLYCGHCGAAMNGESGTSRSGKTYYYYTCRTHKQRGNCDKRPIRKDYIEQIVVREAYALLSGDVFYELVNTAIDQNQKELADTSRIPALTSRLKSADASIENIVKAIETGIASDALLNRLAQLEQEKKSLQSAIEAERENDIVLDRVTIENYLNQFRHGSIDDPDFQRNLIDLLINSVTVWDEPDGYRVSIAYNLTDKPSATVSLPRSTEDQSGDMFGFESSRCTIGRIIEPAPAVYVYVQTRKHPLP